MINRVDPDPNSPAEETETLVFHHSATIRGPGFVLVNVGRRIVSEECVTEYSTSFEQDLDDLGDDESDEWGLESETIS
jgi:hypothetical protein